MQFSFLILAIFAAAAKDVNGIKLNVDHSTLRKRQSTDQQCIATCNSFSSVTSQCYSQTATGGYAACICSTSAVQALASCVNCGVSASASQADINAIESSVNTYLSACASLGYPVTVPVTTQPNVQFTCSIGFNTGAGTHTVTTTGQQTVTVTTGAPSGTDPFAVPSDFSIDPAEASLISSLLGGTTVASHSTASAA